MLSTWCLLKPKLQDDLIKLTRKYISTKLNDSGRLRPTESTEGYADVTVDDEIDGYLLQQLEPSPGLSMAPSNAQSRYPDGEDETRAT